MQNSRCDKGTDNGENRHQNNPENRSNAQPSKTLKAMSITESH